MDKDYVNITNPHAHVMSRINENKSPELKPVRHKSPRKNKKKREKKFDDGLPAAKKLKNPHILEEHGELKSPRRQTKKNY